MKICLKGPLLAEWRESFGLGENPPPRRAARRQRVYAQRVCTPSGSIYPGRAVAQPVVLMFQLSFEYSGRDDSRVFRNLGQLLARICALIQLLAATLAPLVTWSERDGSETPYSCFNCQLKTTSTLKIDGEIFKKFLRIRNQHPQKPRVSDIFSLTSPLYRMLTLRYKSFQNWITSNR